MSKLVILWTDSQLHALLTKQSLTEFWLWQSSTVSPERTQRWRDLSCTLTQTISKHNVISKYSDIFLIKLWLSFHKIMILFSSTQVVFPRSGPNAPSSWPNAKHNKKYCRIKNAFSKKIKQKSFNGKQREMSQRHHWQTWQMGHRARKRIQIHTHSLSGLNLNHWICVTALLISSWNRASLWAHQHRGRFCGKQAWGKD